MSSNFARFFPTIFNFPNFYLKTAPVVSPWQLEDLSFLGPEGLPGLDLGGSFRVSQPLGHPCFFDENLTKVNHFKGFCGL